VDGAHDVDGVDGADEAGETNKANESVNAACVVNEVEAVEAVESVVVRRSLGGRVPPLIVSAVTYVLSMVESLR
jgi:hypothetical protein